jgi:hypothetical protein
MCRKPQIPRINYRHRNELSYGDPEQHVHCSSALPSVQGGIKFHLASSSDVDDRERSSELLVGSCSERSVLRSITVARENLEHHYIPQYISYV